MTETLDHGKGDDPLGPPLTERDLFTRSSST